MKQKIGYCCLMASKGVVVGKSKNNINPDK